MGILKIPELIPKNCQFQSGFEKPDYFLTCRHILKSKALTQI